MIIVDPVAIGDVSVTGGGGTFCSRDGVLRTAPPNTLRVTYDPSDLSKAPYALIEPEATNRARNNTMQGAVAGSPGTLPSFWGFAMAAGLTREVKEVGVESNIDYIDIRFSGTAAGQVIVEFESTNSTVVAPGEVWVGSFYLAQIGGSFANVISSRFRMREGLANGTFVTDELRLISPRFGALREQRFEQSRIVGASSERLTFQVLIDVSGAVDFTIRIGLPQLERDRLTSPIKTSGAAVTRAADVIGPGAGLVYSSVPISEQDYSATATYAKDALVHDPVTHGVFRSLIDANKGRALTDAAAWNPRGATNRWAMFDQYNNTQTSAPDEIIVVLSPQSICEGLYLGEVDADEIELSVVDRVEGVVYSEVASLVTSSGSSSYYDWCFRPADRADYFVTQSMPPYASALVTIAIRKNGGDAKVGMCAIGVVDEFGPSLYGLSVEGRDYSSTTFNFDGTSETTFRPYAKRMSVDVRVSNSEIDYIQRKLFQYRQRPIVWIGGPYGATAVFGRYGSFKIVIPSLHWSDMALQIEGSV